MPTKRRRRQEVAPEQSPAVAPQEALELAEEKGPDLSVFDASGDTRVRVLWRDPQRQKWTTHGYLPPSVTEEDILKLFGGGEYMLQLLVQNEEGREVIKQTRRMKLVGAHKIPPQLPGINDPPPGASTTPQTPEIGNIDAMNPNAALNHALAASVIDLLKSMREVKAPQPAIPQIPWGEVLTTVVGPLVLELVRKKDNGKSEILETLKQLQTMMPANPAAAPVQSTITDMVKGIKELMGLKDIVEGKEVPPDPETAMWGAAMKAMDIAAQYVTGKKGGDGTTPQPQLTAGAPGMPKWKLMLLAQRKRLVEAASYNLPPDTAAETALTFLPQQMHGVLTEFLELPDHVDITIQTIPELSEFRSWTTEFMEQLRTQFLGGEEEEDAEEAERGKAGES